MKHVLLIENDDNAGEIVAVGLFDSDDDARDWEEAKGDSLGTVRGVIPVWSTEQFLKEASAR